ncbi:MAG: hypothetical protein V1804_01490 [Patescibacteria group bacterium]
MTFEKIYQNRGEEENDEFFAIRHSKAEGQLHKGIVKSDNPEATPSSDKQWFNSDLTPEGIKLAHEKAEEFFSNLDPQKDALYFVSSDLVRAAQTAKIYLDVARRKGFEIIQPREKSEKFPDNRPNKAEEIGEGEIRKIRCLTLDHLENVIRERIFKPDNYLEEAPSEIRDKVSPETKEKWAVARKIVEADNKGTWGDNYVAYSEEIEKIFPNVKSAETVYKLKFMKMLRLIKFAQEKINEQNPEKNIKILGFSHENSFLYFLNKNFGESMKHCESIAFKVEDGETNDKKIMVTTKGKTMEVK